MKIRSFDMYSLIAIAVMLLPAMTIADDSTTSNQAKSGDTFTEPLVNMQLIYIEPGSFIMGSPETELNRYPDETQHKVEIKKGFWMGKYEVTFKQYDAFCKATHHAKARDEHWGRDKRPVINLKWFDAVDFVRWLSAESGHHYRLPTEAEWEYAARAGTTTAYSFGEDPKDFPDYAWNTTNANSQTHPVGLKKPNPWGLYDMHGNVWEWTASTYNEAFDGSELKTSSYKSNARRSVRGGAWYFYPKGMRSADRRIYHPRLRLAYIGFRLVREP